MIEYLPCSHEELPRSLRWDVTSRDPDPLVEVAYAHREIESDEAIRGAAYRRVRDRCTGEAIYARRSDVADVDVRVLREVGQRRRVTREGPHRGPRGAPGARARAVG